MAGLVQQVCANVARSCVVTKINKDGCSVSLKGAPRPRLIVDFDKPGSPRTRNQVRCDYLFIAEGSSNAGLICPLELKKGKFHMSVVDQLRAGARIAERIVPPNKRAKFRPVAACGGRHKGDLTALRNPNNQVSFQGVGRTVKVIRCGDKLTMALKGVR